MTCGLGMSHWLRVDCPNDREKQKKQKTNKQTKKPLHHYKDSLENRVVRPQVHPIVPQAIHIYGKKPEPAKECG